MTEEKKEMGPKLETQLTQPKARGFEEPTQREDLEIPRAKLLQALSPEVVESPGDFHPGQLINSVTQKVLPEVFIPVFKFTVWIRFNPRKKDDPNFDPSFSPGAMIWRSSDPYDAKVLKEGQFGPSGEKPAATKFLNFFSCFPGVDMPVVVSFSSTSFKAGKKLLSLAQFARADMFSRRYRLKAKQESNDLGTYFVLTVVPDGDVDKDGGDFKFAEALWKSYHMRVKEIQVHDEEKTQGDEVPF